MFYVLYYETSLQHIIEFLCKLIGNQNNEFLIKLSFRVKESHMDYIYFIILCIIIFFCRIFLKKFVLYSVSLEINKQHYIDHE